MSLRRTQSALHSLSLFWKVDYVAYCEGGEPYAIVDPHAGHGHVNTLDALYWGVVLRRLKPRKRIRVLSIGSKKAVLEIAEDIVQANVATVIACLDTDYDELRQTLRVHQSIYYTRGYSWENDVFLIPVVEEVFYTFNPRSDEGRTGFSDLRDQYDNFFRTVKKYCEFDIALVLNGRAGLFRRQNPGSFVHRKSGHIPSLDENALRSQLAKLGFKRGPRVKKKLKDSHVPKRVVGKMLPSLVSGLLQCFGPSRRSIQGVANTAICYMAISKFESLLGGSRLRVINRHFGI